MLAVIPRFIPIFSALQNYSCNDFSTIAIAKKQADAKIQIAVQNFLREAANNFNQKKKSEQDIHKLPTVRLLVDEFVQRLNCQN